MRDVTVFFFVAFWALVSSADTIETKAESVGADPVWEIRHILPEVNLENNTVTNVTVQIGTNAYLPCVFRHLADHQVSWVRRRDWHILTAGLFTYTTDARFAVWHPQESDDWTLEIKYTTSRDAGTYECQLSTSTGVISQFVNLGVVVPQAVIIGPQDYHVQLGSTIRLECVIKQSPTPPQYVFWYRDDHLINYDRTRGGINITAETGTDTKSIVTIKDARYDDTGNYTCSAANTLPASISVYVSHGDKMAAILRRKASSSSSTGSSLPMLLLSGVVALAPYSQLQQLIDIFAWGTFKQLKATVIER